MMQTVEMYRDSEMIVRVTFDGDRVHSIDEITVNGGTESVFGLRNDYKETFYFFTPEEFDRAVEADQGGWRGESGYNYNHAEHYVVLQ